MASELTSQVGELRRKIRNAQLELGKATGRVSELVTVLRTLSVELVAALELHEEETVDLAEVSRMAAEAEKAPSWTERPCRLCGHAALEHFGAYLFCGHCKRNQAVEDYPGVRTY